MKPILDTHQMKYKILIVLCAITTPAWSQTTIKGTVLNGSRDSSAVQSQTVHLLALESAESSPEHRAEDISDQQGKVSFRIERVTMGVQFALSTTYQGVRYFSDPVQPRDPVTPLSTSLVVYDSTRSTDPIRQGAHHIFVRDQGNVLNIRETRVLVNTSNKTIVGSFNETAHAPATLVYTLPSTEIREVIPLSENTRQEWVHVDDKLYDPAVLLPGMYRVSYGYQIAWTDQTIELAFRPDLPTENLNLFNDSPNLHIHSPDLTDRGEMEFRGTRYRRFSADSLSANNRVRVSIKQHHNPATASKAPLMISTAAVLILGLLIYIRRHKGQPPVADTRSDEELLRELGNIESKRLEHPEDLDLQERRDQLVLTLAQRKLDTPNHAHR
jgi:hypothetical protein